MTALRAMAKRTNTRPSPAAGSSCRRAQPTNSTISWRFFAWRRLINNWVFDQKILDLSDHRPSHAFSYPEVASLPKETAMLKTSLMAAFVAVMLSPAYAAEDMCNDAHMKQMDEMIAKMTDASKKKEATKHLDMSKAEMKKGDKAACMKHMNEAHKAMGM
jgi:hypothetical protein